MSAKSLDTEHELQLTEFVTNWFHFATCSTSF